MQPARPPFNRHTPHSTYTSTCILSSARPPSRDARLHAPLVAYRHGCLVSTHPPAACRYPRARPFCVPITSFCVSMVSTWSRPNHIPVNKFIRVFAVLCHVPIIPVNKFIRVFAVLCHVPIISQSISLYGCLQFCVTSQSYLPLQRRCNRHRSSACPGERQRLSPVQRLRSSFCVEEQRALEEQRPCHPSTGAV